jgi:hypothetical protein
MNADGKDPDNHIQKVVLQHIQSFIYISDTTMQETMYTAIREHQSEQGLEIYHVEYEWRVMGWVPDTDFSISD